MSKPRKTVADYMVIAISPALIMALVGSLCFFLIEVFYRGKMIGSVCWVMFWFVIAIVGVGRIAIESGKQQAAIYGFALALATWFYLIRTHPAYILGIVLLAIVWFCAHQLVWDCTLIDDEDDSSGEGLLQKHPTAKPAKKTGRATKAPQNPGRWVIYFSLAAVPLFGVGQMLLPPDAATLRRNGFIFLAVYLTAALGLLVTTSFLGLRRYLRQRYLNMPPVIALAWLKFGVGVAGLVLIAAIFLPRPGAGQAWAALSYQIDYQLRRASKYASPANPHGEGEGRPGNDPGGKEGAAKNATEEQGKQPAAGQDQSGKPPPNAPAVPNPSLPAGASGVMYNFLRIAFALIAIGVVLAWIVRHRQMLLEMVRAAMAAIKQFLDKFLHLAPLRKRPGETEPAYTRAKRNSFAEYKNPFFTARDHAWPPEQIIIYSYEAVQVWGREHGIAPRPEETAREFCHRLAQENSQWNANFSALSRLYVHAAYNHALPPESDLEPIRELWRQLPTTVPQTAA